MLREVIVLGDPRLRQRSRKISTITPKIQKLIDDMVETMHQANGVGLAAVQVGEMKRIIIVETPEDEEDPHSGRRFIVLNPEIVKSSHDTEIGIEGCLSVPGYVGEVERATSIVVRGMNRHGKSIRLRLRGFVARVFQHEIDHCNGILYIDRMGDADRIWSVTEGEEEQIEAAQTLPEMVA